MLSFWKILYSFIWWHHYSACLYVSTSRILLPKEEKSFPESMSSMGSFVLVYHHNYCTRYHDCDCLYCEKWITICWLLGDDLSVLGCFKSIPIRGVKDDVVRSVCIVRDLKVCSKQTFMTQCLAVFFSY